MVRYLMNHTTFATTMIDCMKHPVCKDQLTPLVQSLGNIAACRSFDGGPLFSTIMITSLPTMTPMVGQLLQIPTNGEVVQQAAWLASCLLHDAGEPDHPATTIAAPKLVPLLFQELRENTPHSFQNQGELTQALRSALSKPVAESNTSFDSNLIFLPAWNTVRSALFTLVRLIGSVDADACLAGMTVVKLLLERNDDYDRIRVALIEADITTVLEKLCDTADEEVGEIAATLLDTFFYVDEEMDGYIDSTNLPQDGFFAFGAGISDGHSEVHEGRGRGRGTTLPAWMNQMDNPMNPTT